MKSGAVAVGHPVDVATGTMFDRYADFSLWGLAPLSFDRYYSTALCGTSSPLGFGWRHNFQHEFRATLEGFLWTDADGSEHPIYDRGGVFDTTGKLVLPGAQIELQGTRDLLDLEDYGGGAPLKLRFKRRTGTSKYQLISLVPHEHNRIDLSYDAHHRLASATQTRSGSKYVFRYDASHRIKRVEVVTDVREVVSEFHYDKAGDLVEVHDPFGIRDRFEYDAQHRMRSNVSRGGAVYTFRYDADGRCTFASGTDGFEERTLEYDVGAMQTRVRDSAGHETLYDYNDSGQVLRVTNPLGANTSTVYDDDGRIVQEVGPTGVPSETFYDDLGHVRGATFPDGSMLEIEWSEQHTPVSVTDAAGRTWQYEHDDQRQLKRSVNPLGAECRYEYSPTGDIAQYTAHDGGTWRYYQDVRGYFAGFGDPSGHAWHIENDHYGRTTKTTNPLGCVTKLRYDGPGNLTEVLEADGRRYVFAYDDANRLVRERSPDGSITSATYNACGQAVQVVQADGSTLEFEWGREPAEILSIKDGNGNRIRYQYDAAGRPIEREHWDGGTTRFAYDMRGNVVEITDATGGQHAFEYDDFHRVSLRRTPDGEETTFEYNETGFPVRIANSKVELEWERDLYGLPLAEIQNGVRVEYGYSEAGRPTSLRSAWGADVEHQFNNAGDYERLHSDGHEIGFDYNAIGQELTRNFSGGGSFSRRYDVAGRLIDEWYNPPKAPSGEAAAAPQVGGAPAPFRRVYRYDGGGRLSTIRDSLRGDTHLQHDALGRLRASLRSTGSADYFEWDDANNRTASAHVSGSQPPSMDAAFTKDAQGRMRFDLQALARHGAVTTEAKYGPGNRVRDLRNPEVSVFYESDSCGRIVRKTVNRGHDKDEEVWHYEWDADGRLGAVVRPGGDRWTYDYCPLGRRIAKHGPTGSWHYVWDDGRLLHERGPDETVTTYVHHPITRRPLLRHLGEKTEFLLPDLLHNISETVEPDGTLTWARNEGVWGEPAPDAPDGQPGFVGQWYDAESGLFYNHHRYYDPQLGRYLTSDPLGLLGGFNDFAYVPSPYEWIDPDGLIVQNLGGGPMTYTGGNDDSGRPALRSDRTVSDTSTNGYGNRTVPAPGRGSQGPDAEGKTIAVVRANGETDGGRAFVSGQGRRPNQSRKSVPRSWRVGRGQMGNYTHAEIQALNWLRRNGPPGDYTLYIDRPCCAACDGSVPRALRTLAKKGINVEVRYMRTTADGTEWDDGVRTRQAGDGC